MIEGKAAAKAELRKRMKLSNAGGCHAACCLQQPGSMLGRELAGCCLVRHRVLACQACHAACLKNAVNQSTPLSQQAHSNPCCDSDSTQRVRLCVCPACPLSDVPVVGVVTRLTHQKGIHLIKHAAWRSLERGAQFVLLGSAPDPKVQVCELAV